jgi:hypothetical protein
VPVLLDLEGAGEEACNHCLEGLFKAMAEPEPSDDGIWAPHHDPLIAPYIEDATRRLQHIAQAIQDAFARILTGELIGRLQKSEVPWLRWDPGRFLDAENYLNTKPSSSYTLDDWMLVVDVLLQRYLGEDVIQSEAEYLTVRAQLLGKLQANMPGPGLPSPLPSTEQIEAMVPTRFATVPARVLTPQEMAILHIAKASAAQHISSVTEGVRARMKGLVIEHVQAQVLGQKEGTPTYLKTRLFDAFGQLNRDFRRIAVTEVGESVNQGFIASIRIGAKVRRIEAYTGACEFCRSINGKVFEVVRPDAWTDGQTQVWVGKNNIGRSAAPRKRVGGLLIERTEKELWWPASGLQHPHCRGAWQFVLDQPPPGVDPAFFQRMKDRLARA